MFCTSKKIAVFNILCVILITSLCSCFNKNFSTEMIDGKEKIKLSVVSFGTDYDLDLLANEYQLEHPEIEVSINYEENIDITSDVLTYNGIEKVKRDISVGKGPDIIDFGTGFTTSNILGNYTEDLTGYIKNSDILFIENLIQSFSYNDQICAIPTSVMILSLMVDKKYALNNDYWNVQQIIDYYEDFHQIYPESFFTYGETKEVVFDMLTTFSVESFIDWENLTCDFECDDFKKIVKFCNQFSDEFPYESFPSCNEFYHDYLGAVECGGYCNPIDFYSDKEMFGNRDFDYIGYPSIDGMEYFASTTGHTFAISKNSLHKQEAWDFIETFFKDDYQRNVEYCPISQKIFEERITKALKANDVDPIDISMYGNSITDDTKEPYGQNTNSTYEFHAVTEQDAEVIQSMVFGTYRTTCYDYELLGIINEEVSAYFSGEKSLEDVCSNIQKRVQIYVSERG